MFNIDLQSQKKYRESIKYLMRKSVFQFKYQDMSIYVFQNYIFEVTAEGINKMTFDKVSKKKATSSLFWYYKSVNARHQIKDVEYLHLFFYNKRVIGLAWSFLDYHIRHKNCQPSLIASIRLSRLN